MGNGATIRHLKAAERHKQALQLRIAGATLSQIADKLGYASTGAAANAIRQQLDKIPRAHAEEYLALELQRLDQLQTVASAKLGDTEQSLGAIHAILKIMERRAKLLGLDFNESRIADALGQSAILEAEKLQLLTHAFFSTLVQLGLPTEIQQQAPEIFEKQLANVGLLQIEGNKDAKE